MPSPSLPYRHVWRALVPELVLVALAILAYGDTLAFGYAWDDKMLVRLDLSQALERSFQGLHVRPVWYLSYVLTQQLAESAVFEHLVNLTLFALATVLAHRLALAWLERPGAAWIVTLVWMLLPWNAYPVTWIAQRNDLLVFVFGFSAVLALRRGRYLLAWLTLALAMFSKVTVAFVPLYFLWHAFRSGYRRAALAFGLLFITYLALALRGYALYLETAQHLEPLAWSLRMLRFPLHWLEHLALLAVPMPFFLSIGHALFYLIGLAGLLFSSQPANKPAEQQGGARGTGGAATEPADICLLALLASLPTAVTPELRICGFESLFWLLAIARLRSWRSLVPAASALAAVLMAFTVSIAATKPIFDRRPGQPATDEQSSLYPNDYYRLRRQMLLRLVSAAPGTPRDNRGPRAGAEARDFARTAHRLRSRTAGAIRE